MSLYWCWGQPTGIGRMYGLVIATRARQRFIGLHPRHNTTGDNDNG